MVHSTQTTGISSAWLLPITSSDEIISLLPSEKALKCIFAKHPDPLIPGVSGTLIITLIVSLETKKI